MMKFLKKLFGPTEYRPGVGEPRVTYWNTPSVGWNFHVQDGNNEVVCQSTQGYRSEAEVLSGIENARDAFNNATPVRRELDFNPR
jgi:uncharacterized protein YegP (UPF0339 family)